jgi:hypothetical protein
LTSPLIVFDTLPEVAGCGERLSAQSARPGDRDEVVEMAAKRSVFGLGTYGGALFAVLLIAALGLYFGEQPALVFTKAVAVAVGMIALYGLERIFDGPDAKTRWTAQYWEFHLLYAFIFASMMAVMLYKPDSPLGGQLLYFGLMFPLMAALRLWMGDPEEWMRGGDRQEKQEK